MCPLAPRVQEPGAALPGVYVLGRVGLEDEAWAELVKFLVSLFFSFHWTLLSYLLLYRKHCFLRDRV